jgi:hypothetical protein
MARADAAVALIAPVFAGNPVHEPVHEPPHLLARAGYGLLLPIAVILTRLRSRFVGPSGLGGLILGTSLVLATKPPGVTPAYHEHQN